MTGQGEKANKSLSDMSYKELMSLRGQWRAKIDEAYEHIFVIDRETDSRRYKLAAEFASYTAKAEGRP